VNECRHLAVDALEGVVRGDAVPEAAFRPRTFGLADDHLLVSEREVDSADTVELGRLIGCLAVLDGEVSLDATAVVGGWPAPDLELEPNIAVAVPLPWSMVRSSLEKSFARTSRNVPSSVDRSLQPVDRGG